MSDRMKELEQRLKAATRKHWTYRLELLGRIEDQPFYRLSMPHRGRHTFSLCLATGVHGDEPAGVEAMLRLIEEQAVPAGVAIDCFPCMNPVGYARSTREDLCGQDLNRLFGVEEPPEPVRLFAEAMRGRQYDLFVDLHEDSGTTGFYAYEMAGPQKMIGRDLARFLASRSMSLECADALTRLLQEDGLMPTKGTIEDGLALLEPGGSPTCFAQAVYMYGDHASHVMTFESPSTQPMEPRVTMHLEGMRFILDQVGKQGLFWDMAHTFQAAEPRRKVNK